MWPWYNEVNLIRTRVKQMSYRKFKYKQHKKHNHKYLQKRAATVFVKPEALKHWRELVGCDDF